MTRLLLIEASPRKSLSRSSEGGRIFLEEFRKCRPDVAIDRLDLWTTELPEFNGARISAKYAKLAGRALDENEEKAWSTIASIVDRLRRADAVLIATPMWNFGIPYKLKHWIDLITQPGLTFSFTPQVGYRPLLPAKPTIVILSSAGDYSADASFGRPDLATPYLWAALAFIGLTKLTFVPIGPTVGATDAVELGWKHASDRLVALARTLTKELVA
jgi:FMN-dependent NADH-azoreductase